MIPFGLTGGLNTAGLSVGGLNPVFTQTVVLGELGEVKVFTLSDGSVVMFTPEGQVFTPDVSVFARVEPRGAEVNETTPTGLDPQPDPPQEFRDKESIFETDPDLLE
jgi:hypothetical protein